MEIKNTKISIHRLMVYDLVAAPGFSDAIFIKPKEDVIDRRNRIIKKFNMS